ncbi:hypothetical protein CPB85DRAFT_1375843 [Mucidula mucida]|nr:hypothetical protein CPB85DRAFT_1375843 [Mucidula mucida]
MTTTTKIFLTGVTGYIGGTFLSQLLLHPSVKTFEITVLVRSAEKAQLLKALNVNHKLLTEQVDCDNLDAARAILAGLKLHHQRTGVPPSLIHTSVGTLSEFAKGMHGTEEVYSDLDIPHIESLPPTAPHRHVDLEIVDADKQGYAKTYIVLPCLVYGEPSGVLVDKGIQNIYSIQLPQLIEPVLRANKRESSGSAECVEQRSRSRSIPTRPIGYYFAENGEHEFIDLSKAVGAVLSDLGIGSPEPQTFTPEEATQPLAGARDYNLEGFYRWKPSRGTDALFASVSREVQALLSA